MEGPEQQGAEQMDMEGNEQTDMDDDDEHETENNGAKATDGHETADSIASGSSIGLVGGATPLCLHLF
jgi:hypothetical protein